jgi:hypothetical protein
LGLEHLSSVFAEGVGTNNSQIEGRHSSELIQEPELHWDNHSLYDFNTPTDNIVDYQNSAKGGFTYISPQPFPDGFTLNFNKSGYTFGEGDRGNSKFINITSQNYGTLTHTGLEAFQFYPLSIGNSRYGQYLSETPGAPTNVENYEAVGFNKTYDSINYKTGYTGTKYDDEDTIGIDRFPYFKKSRTFNVDRPESSFSFTNPPSNINEYKKSKQFDLLYNDDQTSNDVTDLSVSLNFNRSGLENNPGGFKPLAREGFRGGEPYHISKILNEGDRRTFGREFPIQRSINDVGRIGKFLTSSAGLLFIAKQNFLGLNSKVVYNDNSLGLEKKAGNQRFKNLYNPLSTMGSLVRLLGGQVPNVGLGFLLDREDPMSIGSLFKSSTYGEFVKNTSINGGPGPQENEFSYIGEYEKAKSKFKNALLGNNVKDLPKTGDKMTLSSMIKGDRLKDIGAITMVDIGTPMVISDTTSNIVGTNIESEKAGLPFYFKDLRDNTYIFFRAYLESITENISPSWSSENYIGRSEPTYIYERAERDISFSLKLFATTKGELDKIYQKMNRLTSMCYPQYKEDIFFADEKQDDETDELTRIKGTGKIRMKPPLVKFRMGDLYGSENKEMTGFIKSISNSIPDNSPWETIEGMKVPKFIMLSIGFQVIHNKVPELGDKFYGVINKIGLGT